jgi:uncharacterized protein
MSVFVDTAAWIALFNKSDDLHLPAKQLMNQLQQNNTALVTTEFVLLEFADAFCDSKTRSLAVQYVDRLRRLNRLEIVPISQELLTAGWVLYRQRLDKSWGLTDCTSFIVLGERKITEAFTSDRHFEQAGFMRLL